MSEYTTILRNCVVPGSGTVWTLPYEMGKHSAVAVQVTVLAASSITSFQMDGSNDGSNWTGANPQLCTPTTLTVPTTIPGTSVTNITKFTAAFLRVRINAVNAVVNVAIKPIET